MLTSRKKKSPKRVLALPDLEQARAAVLNSLSSVSGQRTYDHAIDELVRWYCSEPRIGVQSHRRAPVSHHRPIRTLARCCKALPTRLAP